jgi:hypothetical protein
MHRRIAADRLPSSRTVLELRYTGAKAETIWMVLDRGEASVCTQHPGYDVDVVVVAATEHMADVFQGYARWEDHVRDGHIEVQGVPRLAEQLPSWFLWSPWVDVTHERARRVDA